MQNYFAAFLPQQGGGYTVLFPDLPGLQTEGDNLDEAFSMAMDALNGHFQVLYGCP